MSPDTPLPEVAHHLGISAAALLSVQPSDVQILVLTIVRTTVQWWEKNNVQFDAIQYEAALEAVVTAVVLGRGGGI